MLIGTNWPFCVDVPLNNQPTNLCYHLACMACQLFLLAVRLQTCVFATIMKISSYLTIILMPSNCQLHCCFVCSYWIKFIGIVLFVGRIKAIQLDYSEAHRHLLQAMRKAPQHTAVGFKQTVSPKRVICLSKSTSVKPEFLLCFKQVLFPNNFRYFTWLTHYQLCCYLLASVKCTMYLYLVNVLTLIF